MRLEYDVIFLGCSCFAMGCAAQRPDQTLILESGEGLGPEFVDALFAGKAPIKRPEGQGAALYDELVARGIMTAESAAKGEVHVPAINLVFNRLALEKKLNILFHMRVIKQACVADGVEVTAACNGKVYTFHCKKVIDTRADYTRIKALDSQAQCQLRANMYVEDDRLPSDWDSFTVHVGYLSGETYLAMPVTQTNPPELEAFLQAFERRPAQAYGMRLLTVAHAHAIVCQALRVQNETGWFIPGCGFDNPVQAWAAGLEETEVFA